MNKRGQFFILTAVIIAAILVTFSQTINYAKTNKEPEKFYDFSSQIKQEGGEAINYGLYNGKDISPIMEDYITKLSQHAKSLDPNMELLIIYGNKNTVTIENYARNDTEFMAGNSKGTALGCSKTLISETSLELDGTEFNVPTSSTLKDYYLYCKKTAHPSSDAENIIVNLGNSTYTFPLLNDQQLWVVLQKNADNETYVAVK